MKIVLTPEEKSEYLKLDSTQDKQVFEQKAYNRRVRVMNETVVLTTLLLEKTDELKSYGLYRQAIKRTGNPFLNQLSVYINKVWKTSQNKELADDLVDRLGRHMTQFLEDHQAPIGAGIPKEEDSTPKE